VSNQRVPGGHNYVDMLTPAPIVSKDEYVDILIAAAGAAHQAASWLPGAAVSVGDYELLGDAADIMAKQPTRQRW